MQKSLAWFKCMALDRKVFMFFSLINAGILIAIYIISRIIILDSFQTLEDRELERQIQQIKQFLETELNQLKTVNQDYAAWDDTYTFAQKRDKKYIRANFVDETFQTNRWNTVIILDDQKKVLYQKAFDLEQNRSVYMSKKLLELVRDKNALLGEGDQETGNAGIISLEEGYMFVSAQPIVTSNHEKPSQGYVIMGRYLDSHKNSKLFSGLEISVTLEEFMAPLPNKDKQIESVENFGKVIVWTENIDRKRLKGHMLIHDIYGNPIFSLVIERHKDIYIHGQSSILYFLGVIFFTVVLFFFIMTYLMKKIVFQRLQMLVASVNHISQHQDFSARVTISAKDEFSILENKFNMMMEELEKTQKEILHKSNHDALTNLPNREYFFQQVERSLDVLKSKRSMGAIFFIDFDGFKNINDNFGHQVGDELLELIPKKIKKVVPEESLLSRLGGDEFTIFIPDIKELNKIEEIAQDICNTFARPFCIDKKQIHVTASVGISIYPFDGIQPDILVNNADVAMYRIKQNGKNGYTFYSEEMRNKYTVEMLKKALKNEEFQVYYQPQVNCRTGKIEGAEALLRWKHPMLGMIPPDKFIPIAEETGLIHSIGEWVLRTVCSQNKKWQEQEKGTIRVAVNISGIQFMQKGFVETVRKILEETKLDPTYLELEITESTGLHNNEEVIKKLIALREMNIRIAIDDFGTGYSSLSYIERFQMDSLKIDKVFVQNINHKSNIAKMIIGMANGLGLSVVGEGVETREQMECLLNLGCFLIQGYYFSRPLPCEQFEKLLGKGELIDVV